MTRFKEMHKIIFDTYDGTCLDHGFVLLNYGKVLARSDETREEGQEYIKRGSEMVAAFPRWHARKSQLFVPEVIEVDQIQFNF